MAYGVGAVLLAPFAVADPPFGEWPLLALSSLAHAAYVWFLSGAYDRGALATTYPVARGCAPLIVAAAGVWFLDQTPSLPTVAGAASVAVGLVLLGGVAAMAGERSALLMALATGGCIAHVDWFGPRFPSQRGFVRPTGSGPGACRAGS